MDSGGCKDEHIRLGPDPHARKGNFEGEKGPAQDIPDVSGSTVRMPIAVY